MKRTVTSPGKKKGRELTLGSRSAKKNPRRRTHMTWRRTLGGGGGGTKNKTKGGGRPTYTPGWGGTRKETRKSQSVRRGRAFMDLHFFALAKLSRKGDENKWLCRGPPGVPLKREMGQKKRKGGTGDQEKWGKGPREKRQEVAQ